MKLSILHISDLHRDSDNPISNIALLNSLKNDRDKYTTGKKPEMLRPPDLIIVSGDIIQGIKPDDPDPDVALRKQYQEALCFLSDLTDSFVKGVRDRVIVVPGNHDVSANHFHKSLCHIEIRPDRGMHLFSQLFSPESDLRWSWQDFNLYKITDRCLYSRRLAAFADFYGEFYKGKRTFHLDPEKQFDLFDFPEFELTVVGFSSCHNNDLFNKVGEVHPESIAIAGNQFSNASINNRLRIAVWHHNVEGRPARSDYMDPEFLQQLIVRGFSLGFHGHQHRPQFLDTRFRHGSNRKIIVISAGTLCGTSSDRCNYNIVELDTKSRNCRYHVRAMLNKDSRLPIWGQHSLPPNTNSYYKFKYDPPPKPAVPSNGTTKNLNDALDLYNKGTYQLAAEILKPVLTSDDLARPLLLDCLLKLKDITALIDNFDPPTNENEAIHIMDALWEQGKRARLKDVLQLPLVADSTDISVIEIRRKYEVKLSK